MAPFYRVEKTSKSKPILHIAAKIPGEHHDFKHFQRQFKLYTDESHTALLLSFNDLLKIRNKSSKNKH